MLRVRGNTNTTTNTKSAFPAPVCNVILRRYSLLEVPWRRIHNAIAKAMSICVAVGNKVMNTRLPQPAGCGDKYDISGLGLGRMLRVFCTFFKHPSPAGKPAPSPALGEGLRRPWCDKILGTDCASRPRMTGARSENPLGRSMIEMLGVLAIIGVLSVGGIAGYSQAMEKFKMNKAIGDYNMLIFGLLEHEADLKQLATNANVSFTSLINYVDSAGLIPQNWQKINDSVISDAYGNHIQIFVNEIGKLVVDFYLGGFEAGDDKVWRKSKAFNPKLCREIFSNIAAPLHSTLEKAWIYNSNDSFFGDKFCSKNVTCLQNITLSQIKNACNSCEKEKYCAVVFWF